MIFCNHVFGVFRGGWERYLYLVTFTGFAEMNVRRFDVTWPEAPPDFYKDKGRAGGTG